MESSSRAAAHIMTAWISSSQLLHTALADCRLAVAGVVASSAVYVTAKLAEVVGHASYVTALAIAKSLPGHKKRKHGKCGMDLLLLVNHCCQLQSWQCGHFASISLVSAGLVPVVPNPPLHHVKAEHVSDAKGKAKAMS